MIIITVGGNLMTIKCDLCNSRILKKNRKDCIFPAGAAMRLIYHFVVNWGGRDDPFLAKYFYYNSEVELNG